MLSSVMKWERCNVHHFTSVEKCLSPRQDDLWPSAQWSDALTTERRETRGELGHIRHASCIRLGPAMSKESGMCDYLTFAIFLHLSFFNFFAEYLTLCSENYINTCASNMTGHPALSINAGFSEGLPVGMMIVGRKFTIKKVILSF